MWIVYDSVTVVSLFTHDVPEKKNWCTKYGRFLRFTAVLGNSLLILRTWKILYTCPTSPSDIILWNEPCRGVRGGQFDFISDGYKMRITCIIRKNNLFVPSNWGQFNYRETYSPRLPPLPRHCVYSVYSSVPRSPPVIGNCPLRCRTSRGQKRRKKRYKSD